jgi:hypothetical protein
VRQALEVQVVPTQHRVLARRCASRAARRELGKLRQLRDQEQLLLQARRRLHLEHALDAVGDVFQPVHAEGHRHAALAPEHVDQEGHFRLGSTRQNRALEQQGRTSTRALHAAVGDLGHLQLDAHGPRYADQFAFPLQG